MGTPTYYIYRIDLNTVVAVVFKELKGFSPYEAVKRCGDFNRLARRGGFDSAYVYREVE